MKLGRYEFSPTLWPILFTVAFLILLIWLGNWQLGRADHKYKDREIRAKIDTSKVISLKASMNKVAGLLARHVKLEGEFDTKYEAYIANVKYRGQPGFFVITPLKIANSNTSVLVLRGWKKQTAGFNVLPQAKPATAGKIKLQGIIDKAPAVGIKSGQPDEGFPNWPKIIIYVDFDWYKKQLGHDVLPYVIREKSKIKDGLIRDWDAFPAASATMPAEKHMGYAFQWFSLAAVLLVIFLVVNTKRLNNSKETEV